jgi:hypothetical protein
MIALANQCRGSQPIQQQAGSLSNSDALLMRSPSCNGASSSPLKSLLVMPVMPPVPRPDGG